MLVANAFDLWQRDAFFSAAEEIQESADFLESAYRMWLKKKGEGISPEDMDGLSKELQAALSTAKWQLEEFERAVRMSYTGCRDENKIARHQQFVVVMESQISRIEAALRESMDEEKVPFSWVNLDEAERDDLALFISGEPASSSCGRDEYSKIPARSLRESLPMKRVCDQGIGVTDDIRINMDGDCLKEDNGRKERRAKDDIDSHEVRVTNMRRTWTSPDFSLLRVIVPEADEEVSPLMSGVEDSSKVKGPRIFSRHQNWNHQLFRFFYGLQGMMQKPKLLRMNCSIQLMFVFMLSLFIFVPFFVHSA